MRVIATLAGIALALTTPATAAQRDPCKGDAQADMNACAEQGLRKADAELNRVYRELFAKVSPAGKPALRDAQRAWVAYRDRQCAFETMGHQDGSVYPMIRAYCLTRLTQAQTKTLKAQLDCDEGDLSCGSQ